MVVSEESDLFLPNGSGKCSHSVLLMCAPLKIFPSFACYHDALVVCM